MATDVKKCTAKVILLGEAGAGKSTLFYRYCNHIITVMISNVTISGKLN